MTSEIAAIVDYAEVNRTLSEAKPQEILRWAVEAFYPKLTMATAFGPEGCVILHMLAEIEPRVRVFNLDTGYQFPETLELRDRIADRYGIEVELVGAETTIAQYEAKHGGPLYAVDSDRCCHDRKVVPLRSAVAGYDAWISAIRADQSSHRARADVVGWDAKFALAKVNPLLHWTKRDVWAFIVANDVPYNPLHDQGLSLDWLLALHPGGCPGSGRASGPLGGSGQDRVRASLAGQQPALIRDGSDRTEACRRVSEGSMKVSAKAEYACLAILALARPRSDAAPVRIREIAESHAIPERYLVQILLQLKGAGLVHSTRGAAGGYRLARPPEQISLGEVLTAIDGPGEPPRVSTEPAARVLAAVWEHIRLAERAVLDQTSIATLCQRTAPHEWII